MGFRLSSSPLRVPGQKSGPGEGGECCGCSRIGQKMPPQALAQCTPGTHVKTAPCLHSPPRTAQSLPVQARSAPSPILVQHLNLRSWAMTTAPLDPPRPWQPRGCPVIPVLRQGPLSSWLLQDPESGFVCPHPNMWCAWGSRGRGSKWLPRWLVASPPFSVCFSFSLSLFCLLWSLSCYRSHHREGFGQCGDRCGGH